MKKVRTGKRYSGKGLALEIKDWDWELRIGDCGWGIRIGYCGLKISDFGLGSGCEIGIKDWN